MQVVKKLLYTGSKDKTARCWVTAFGENTRTYQKSQHSVSCLKVANGVGESVRVRVGVRVESENALVRLRKTSS